MATSSASAAAGEGAAGLLLVVFVLVLFMCAGIVYFIPTIVAIARHPPNAWAIVLLNVFAGWTFFGWLMSLVLALRKTPPPPEPIPEALMPRSPSPSDMLYLTSALQPVNAQGVVVHPNETFYWVVPRAEILSEQQATDYVANTSGTSLQIVTGWNENWANLRLSEAHRLAVDVSDAGMLAFSNQRVLFLGNRMTVEVPFAQIAGVATFQDGLRINRSGAEPLLLRTGTTRESGVLQRLVNGDIGPHIAAAPASAAPPGARPA